MFTNFVAEPSLFLISNKALSGSPGLRIISSCMLSGISVLNIRSFDARSIRTSLVFLIRVGSLTKVCALSSFANICRLLGYLRDLRLLDIDSRNVLRRARATNICAELALGNGGITIETVIHR